MGPVMDGGGGMQLVEANSEFLFNRPQNSPEAVMIDNSAVVVVGPSAMEGTSGAGAASAMDADLIPTTNFN